MKVLFDANIWIDIAARPKTFPESLEAWKRSEQQKIIPYFPLSAYSSVFYVLKRLISNKAALAYLQFLSFKGVKFAGFTSQEVTLAQTFNFSDHEDACITSIAVIARCDLILSNNVKDFRRSPIPVLSPKAFLKKY